MTNSKRIITFINKTRKPITRPKVNEIYKIYGYNGVRKVLNFAIFLPRNTACDVHMIDGSIIDTIFKFSQYIYLPHTCEFIYFSFKNFNGETLTNITYSFL